MTTSSVSASQRGALETDYGYVLYKGKTPTKPVDLALMGTSFVSFQTDSSGHFQLPYPYLVAPAGAISYLSVTDKSCEQYKIVVCNKSDSMDRRLSAIHYPLNFTRPAILSDSDELRLQSAPGMLKAALVKRKMSDDSRFEHSSNPCDRDIVYIDDDAPFLYRKVLNWRQPGSESQFSRYKKEKPVEGEEYVYLGTDPRMKPAATPGFWIYHCEPPAIPPFMTPLEPIQRDSRLPPQNDDSNISSLLRASLQSTIYWQYLLTTHDDGEATVSFYTNDLPGKFICTLQGLSTEGTIFGQASYAVTP